MTACGLVRRDLGAFVDGELAGTRRQRVAHHLELCAACAGEARAIVAMGDELRASAAAVAVRPPSLDGMASGSISRARAESAWSWRARMARGLGDWHWAMITGGALLATLLCTSFVSALLAFGPKPAREDSLSALMADLGSPAGNLFICGSTGGSRQSTALFEIDNGQPAASRVALQLASTTCRPMSDAEIVDALAVALTRGDRVLTLGAMHPDERKRVENLLAEIASEHIRPPDDVGRSVNVHAIQLVTGTSVFAKPL